MTDANPDCAFVEKRIYLVAQRMGEASPSDFCSDDHKIDVKNSAVPEPDIEHGCEDRRFAPGLATDSIFSVSFL